MAYISLIGKRDTDPAEGVNHRDLSDDDYNRIAYWAAVKYFPSGVSVPGTDAVLDGEGNVVTPAVAPSIRQPTGGEIFEALTDDIYAQIKREVEAYYLAQAEAAARASVPPIVLVPAS